MDESSRVVDAPLPVLGGRIAPPSDDAKVPIVVWYATLLAAVGAVIFSYVTFGAIFTFFNEHYQLWQSNIEGVVGTFLCVALTVANALLISGFFRRRPAAWELQRVLSIIGLLGFPIVTMLHILVLIHWSRPKTKAWFGVD